MPSIPFIPGGESSWLVTTHVFRSKFEKLYSFKMDWRPTTSVDETQLQTFCDTLHAAVGNQVDDVMDHEDFYAETRCEWRNLENNQLIAINSDEIEGAKGGDLEDPGQELESLPYYVAAVFQKVTGKAGRSRRGRFFLPCISELCQHDGIIDSLNQPAFRDIADLFQTERTFGTGTCAPRHRDYKNNVGLPITHIYPLDVLVTRRDRKIGRRGIKID